MVIQWFLPLFRGNRLVRRIRPGLLQVGLSTRMLLPLGVAPSLPAAHIRPLPVNSAVISLLIQQLILVMGNFLDERRATEPMPMALLRQQITIS